MKQIIVASKNPIKITAVKLGFEKMFPNELCEITGVSVQSGVSNQPMTSQETYEGAMNRVNNAKNEFPNADFWVGLEGGIDRRGDETVSIAWVVVRSNIMLGKASTATYVLPPQIAELIYQGKELSEADDIVFGRTNSKQTNGLVGILTQDEIDVTGYYTEAVILSLIPFKNAYLY